MRHFLESFVVEKVRCWHQVFLQSQLGQLGQRSLVEVLQFADPVVVKMQNL
jgi:hypothetical protein